MTVRPGKISSPTSRTSWSTWSGVDLVARIGAETEFALSQAVASLNAFKHGTTEFGHFVQNFLAEFDLGDPPGKAASFKLGADDDLLMAHLSFYPAAPVVSGATWQAMR